MISVRNPFSGETLATLPHATEVEAQHAVARGVETFRSWRRSSSFERSTLLAKVAAELKASFDESAALVRDESGKPIRFAEAEVRRAIAVIEWASAEALRFSGELLRIDAEAHGRPGFGLHTKFPRGLILGITPYNWPLLLVAHKVAPAIAAGCSILIKPSPAAPLSALRLADLFRRVGAPEGLVQVVLADDAGSAALTESPDVAMISFTGSDRVGKLIRKQASDKPLALELGGNAWVAILDDVAPSSLPQIARRIATTGFGFAGQGCVAVQNVAVAPGLRDAFVDAFRRATEGTPFGETRDPSVVSGPVINAGAADRIRTSLAVAARKYEVITSGRPVGIGAHAHPLIVPPSAVLMGELPNHEPVVDDEIFGPVVTVSTLRRPEDLVEQINASRFGLQAGVYTQKWANIEMLYRDLHVGGLVANDVPTARYDHQPYGGVKDSGAGREGVRYAMEEMTESKFLALSSQLA